VLVLPSDDDFDAGFIGRIVELPRQGCDTVCASRMPGDTMQGFHG
jgi:dolichol-phosphate mannosyltransferase